MNEGEHEGEKREEKVKVDPQHRSLLPTLRPYQADAVRSVWLVKVDPQRRVIPGRSVWLVQNPHVNC